MFKCYVCGVEFKAKEKRYKSIFKYYSSDGNKLGTIETYICFGCIEKFTEYRQKENKNEI